jgi:opacity protein-like surface antigen
MHPLVEREMRFHSEGLIMSGRVILCAAGVAAILAMGIEPSHAQFFQGGQLYGRLDLGWSGTTGGNLHDVNFGLDHVITGPNGAAGTLNNHGSGWLGGIGIGGQLFTGFRGDIVYTYRGGYSLDDHDAAVVPNRFRADISSNSVMVNGYGDWLIDKNISAFLGLGIGWANVDVGNITGTGVLQVNPNIFPAVPVAAIATAPGGTRDNFAWQVMVGLSFPIEQAGLTFDLFYRYFDGGHLQTDAGNVIAAGAVVRTYHGAEGAFHANEVVASIRFPFSY